MEKGLGKRLAAEFAGTLGLVAVGTAAIVYDDTAASALGALGVSAAFGLVVAAMILLFGKASGAHINPAVTIGLVFARRHPRGELVPYVVVQCLGAVAGSLSVRAAFGEHPHLGATLPAVSLAATFGLEVLLTLVLVTVILWITRTPDVPLLRVAIIVGAVVGLAAYFGGPWTGASMNPARSVGPGVVSGRLDSLWIYLVAPIVGGLLAKPTCRWLVSSNSSCCADPEDCP